MKHSYNPDWDRKIRENLNLTKIEIILSVLRSHIQSPPVGCRYIFLVTSLFSFSQQRKHNLKDVSSSWICLCFSLKAGCRITKLVLQHTMSTLRTITANQVNKTSQQNINTAPQETSWRQIGLVRASLSQASYGPERALA